MYLCRENILYYIELTYWTKTEHLNKQNNNKKNIWPTCVAFIGFISVINAEVGSNATALLCHNEL